LFTVNTFAVPTNVGISVSIRAEFQGTDDLAFVAEEGDILEYYVTVSLSDDQFPIFDGEPQLVLPDGTVVDLDDALSLPTGGSEAYAPVAYVVSAADLGQQAGAASNEVRALASVTAKSDTGQTIQDVSATTNFDTIVASPDFMVMKECVNPNGTLVGEDADFLITIMNTGDVALDFIVNDAAAVPPLVDLAAGPIAPGGTYETTISIPTTGECESDQLVSNTVEVEGYYNALLIDTKSDTADCPVLCPPSFTVEKVCLTDPITDEPNALFEITITNTGWVPLEFEIDDDAAGIADWMVGPIAPGADFVTTVEVPADCLNGAVSNRVVVQAYFDGEPVLDPMPAEAECPCVGLEGCTPGFWKNHPDCWCGEYQPETLVGDVWVIPAELSSLADDTLMQALNYRGGRGVAGAAQILLRAAVASLLNACSENVDFPLSVDDVINGGNDTLATLDRNIILGVASALDFANNYGCPINAKCEISMDDEMPY
jgi:hypothetical protein